MRKLTRLLVGLSAAAVLMVCMTAVSFAGSANDKVTVQLLAGSPDAVDFAQEIEVTGDSFENAYPDLASADTVAGVSFADAIVAAHVDKYGDDAAKHMGFAASDWGLSVTKQFDHDLVGMYMNNNKSTDGVGVAEVKDGDKLFVGTYSDYNYADFYCFFDKDDVTMNIDKKLALTYKAGNSLGTDWEQVLTLENPVMKNMNVVTGQLEDLKNATAEIKDGQATVTFKDAGIYFLSLTGTATYDNGWSGVVTGKAMGSLVAVQVNPLKPVIKSAKRTAKTKAVVKWKKAKGAKAYDVQYRKAGTKKWTTKTTTKTSITLKKLKANKKYQVRVMAKAAKNELVVVSKWSKAKKINIKK